MKLKDKKGNIWEYIPLKEAKEEGISPREVFGDVFRRTNEKSIGVLTADDGRGGEITAPIYPYKEKLSYAEKVAGYIPYKEGEDGTVYVRAVRKSPAKILIPLVILLALIGGGLVWYLTRDEGPDLDHAAVAYEMPDGAVNTDPTQLMMPYIDQITVTADDRAGHTALVNPEGNQSYFRYVLTLTDSGEEIYRSGLIEPGMAVVDWEISTDLEPGDYDAELAINTYSLDDVETETNGGNMVITLHVE